MAPRKSSTGDDWGRDPAVHRMRRVFAMMEEAQREILSAVGMSPLDRRLRVWRENALRLFEETWSRAGRSGLGFGEQQVADLYGACFVHLLGKAGISVPPSVRPFDDEVLRLAKEALK